ncbi:2-dehydro-3-deoxygluconokinase [compost metagenome]
MVDTVGAGDGFAVGMISALLENHSVAEAVQRANWVGSRAVQSRGDMEGLPTRTEMLAEFETAIASRLAPTLERVPL